MENLEYRFEIETYGSPKKFEGINIPTGRVDYETALCLSEKLGKKGIHYKITEIDPKCGNYQRITSRMLRMPKRQKE